MSTSFVLASGIAEAVLELTLYGVFVVIYSSVVYLFWTRDLISRDRPIFFVFLALIVLFLSITAHWINGIYVFYFAFIHLGGGVDAEAFYLSLSTPTSLAHISLVEVATFITDSLVIHRLYVVWSCNRRVVILPLFALLCQAVSGIRIIYDFSRENLSNFYALSGPWLMTTLVSSLVDGDLQNREHGPLNAQHHWESQLWETPYGASWIHTSSRKAELESQRVLAIMIESSVIQLTMIVCILITSQFDLLAQLVLRLTALQPVIFGISVVLIYARVGLGWAQEPYIASPPSGITLSVSRVTRREGDHDLERGKTHL
ncbi:hypothetical protein DFH09DRAFT_1283817 [Mycena vulgaris]|nr:hypothetical protein DFH09DRAFT_1283817 [Mycena vulgaris]